MVATRMNRVVLLLADAALFYPIYWVAMFAVRAGPVLVWGSSQNQWPMD